jgi:hypothetical protein
MLAAGVFLRQLARGLDKALRTSLARPGMPEAGVEGDGGGGQAVTPASAGGPPRPRPARQFVHNLQVVRARPLYGFHPEERLFIKITL